MTGPLSRLVDRLRGSGEHAVTLPPMDGALRPNRAIEEAELVAQAPAPDNLVIWRGETVFTSGAELRRLDGETVQVFPAPVACLAVSPAGTLAAALEDGRIVLLGGARDGATLALSGSSGVSCPTAIAFEAESRLVVCEGSRRHPPGEWRRDLMERGASGAVRRLRLDGTTETLAEGLAWPAGLALRPDGSLLVAEAWRSRLVEIRKGSDLRPVLPDLPGYPGRLTSRSGGGGFWLCVFAPRSQLVEFVLREKGFREAMLREVDPEHWIAPTLHAPRSFLEPMQGGALKQLGMLKPWAPSRSFGLVVALDASLRPAASLHSRADGRRHGVTSASEDKGRLLVAARGGDAVVALSLALPEPVR